MKQVKYGAVPAGMKFKFSNDDRVWWFIKLDRNIISYADDGNTKVEMEELDFNRLVYVPDGSED